MCYVIFYPANPCSTNYNVLLKIMKNALFQNGTGAPARQAKGSFQGFMGRLELCYLVENSECQCKEAE